MTDYPVKRRKKLIEVAIPVEAINESSAREKNIRHGHHSALHLWWSRKPIGASKAIIFCQLVDDPSAVIEDFPTEEAQDTERLRLFRIAAKLSEWEGGSQQEILQEAKKEIQKSWHRCCNDNKENPYSEKLFKPENPPLLHDPFAGGGSIPLAAQQLGINTAASDINPVAVLINKASSELIYQFKALSRPANQEWSQHKTLIPEKSKSSVNHIAEDVEHYGNMLKSAVFKKIGKLYPSVLITDEIISGSANPRKDLQKYLGRRLNVVAWLWARTVRSPNPMFSSTHIPLITKYIVSSKKGKEAYLEPIVQGNTYSFQVRIGKPPSIEPYKNGTRISRGAFRCILSGESFKYSYVDEEANNGRMGSYLLCAVLEGDREKIFVDASDDMRQIASSAEPPWRPLIESRGTWASNAQGRRYGFNTYADYFSERQLLALSSFSNEIKEVRQLIQKQALDAGFSADQTLMRDGGTGALAYAELISVLLSLLIGQLANHSSTICGWNSANNQMRSTFALQGIPMTWDYAEVNVFSTSSGSFSNLLERQVKGIRGLRHNAPGTAYQASATESSRLGKVYISTDPPYYDNIGYADLSEFFYAWLKPSIKEILPSLFKTITVPKTEEIFASQYRQGGKDEAEAFFLKNLQNAIERIAQSLHPAYPGTIYYAFRQTEIKHKNIAITGWEVFLQSLISCNLAITATWPIATEKRGRAASFESNSLSSSIVLSVRTKDEGLPIASISEFRRELAEALFPALNRLEKCNIAPVDLMQASIGIGMQVFTSFKAVSKADDTLLGAGDVIKETGKALNNYLSEDNEGFDNDTRFAITIFESFGYNEIAFGDAENLAKALNISVKGVSESGILYSAGGKVHLFKRSELDKKWDPSKDLRLTVWETTQHLIRLLDAGGEFAAGSLLAQLKNLPGQRELAVNCRALAYRLYNHCEKTKQTEEARAYNGLVIAWPELERLTTSQASESAVQTSLI